MDPKSHGWSHITMGYMGYHYSNWHPECTIIHFCLGYIARWAVSRCKKTCHVILHFEDNYNAGGRLELLVSIHVWSFITPHMIKIMIGSLCTLHTAQLRLLFDRPFHESYNILIVCSLKSSLLK